MGASGRPPTEGHKEGLQGHNIITLFFLNAPKTCHTCSKESKAECISLVQGIISEFCLVQLEKECMYIHTEEQSLNTAIDFTRKHLPPILDPPISFFRSIYAQSLSHVRLFATPRTVALSGSSVHGIFSGKNTGVGCHFLLQGSFPTQGNNSTWE